VSLLDIHAGLTYAAIAPVLRLEPVTKYAVLAKCPYCEAHAWTIHQDTRNLEEWHYCSQCKVNGSVLAMAAERLEMAQDDALRYLADRLGMTLTFDHLKAYHKSQHYAKQLRETWQQVQKSNLSREEFQLLHQLGWHNSVPVSPARFAAGMGQLYGVTNSSVIKERLDSHYRGGKNLTALVPYYKAINQVGAFYGHTGIREYFFAPPHVGVNAHAVGEYGFAGLPFLLQSQSNTLVLTTMLHVMMQTHAHNFNYNDTPLPLLAWRQHQAGGAERQWSSLGGRDLVLWERTPTAAVLHQAILSDARLSFVGPETDHQQPQEVSGKRWWAWVHDDAAPVVCERIVRSSRPYEHALKNWARISAPADKARLLQDAEQYSPRVAELVRSVVGTAARTTVGMRVNIPAGNLRGAGGSRTYTALIERDGKWFDLQGNIRLPAILRITHTVVRANRKKEHIGYLEHDGRRYEFRVPEAKTTWTWLRDFALENGIPWHVDATANSSFCPFDAACRLQPPELTVGKDQIGWDGTGFQFRNAFLVDGVFTQIPDFILPDDVPGPKQHFAKLHDDVKEALTREGPEMKIMWSFAMALCAQVTAPVLDMEPLSIGLKYPKNDLFLGALYSRFGITRNDYRDWPHRWPRWLESYNKAVTLDDTGFFVARLALDSKPKRYGSMVLDLGDEELAPRAITHSADKVVLNYLREFSTNLPTTPVNWHTWLDETSRRMRKLFPWVRTTALREARQRIILP